MWTYDDFELPPWAGLFRKDANEILEASFIFTYKEGDEFGHGKGSLAGFSDIFRYKLLYMYGGWWTDMDITCLKPLDFEATYVFRNHDLLPVVGNLMKCPAGSPLMEYCFERALKQVNSENKDWLKPIRILNEGVEKFELSAYIRTDLTNPDRWEVVDYYRAFHKNIKDYYAFHWMNEEWRARKIAKNWVIKDSYLAFLMQHYEIEVKIVGAFPKIRYFWLILRKKLITLTSHTQRQKIKRLLSWYKNQKQRWFSKQG